MQDKIEAIKNALFPEPEEKSVSFGEKIMVSKDSYYQLEGVLWDLKHCIRTVEKVQQQIIKVAKIVDYKGEIHHD